MCNHVNDQGGREGAMITIAPGVHCDPCIEPIVRALHNSDLPSVPTTQGPDGIRTIASCCGHHQRPGSIALSDGTWLILMTDDQYEQVAGIWPGINGEPPRTPTKGDNK